MEHLTCRRSGLPSLDSCYRIETRNACNQARPQHTHHRIHHASEHTSSARPASSILNGRLIELARRAGHPARPDMIAVVRPSVQCACLAHRTATLVGRSRWALTHPGPSCSNYMPTYEHIAYVDVSSDGPMLAIQPFSRRRPQRRPACSAAAYMLYAYNAAACSLQA